MLKKMYIAIGLGLAVLLPLVAYSATPPRAGQFEGSDMERQLNAFGGAKGAKLGTPDDPRIIVARLIKTVLGVVGTIAVVLALYAGFLIMTSSGNDEKITEGKKILMYCVIGVAIILGSYSIVYFIYVGIYSSWENPMTIGNRGVIYMQNDPSLYNSDNSDPLNQDNSIPGIGF